MTGLAWQLRVSGTFDDVLQRVTDALKAQGFGVLTRIDVRATMKAKLDVDFRDYVILGACNPTLAHRALSARPEVGVLLPCNVTVESDDHAVVVRIADPEAMMTMGDLGRDPQIASVAAEARRLLGAVAESLSER